MSSAVGEQTRTQEAESNWLLPMSVLIIGTFMSVLDGSIVNVGVPKIQAELSAAADDVEWIVTGFTLALGVAVPLTGWLGDRLGGSRLYVYALLGFAFTSALCGLAWDLNSLIAFRVLQAFPGGIMPVVAMTLVYQIVPPHKLGAAMGIYGVGVSVAPGIGPLLGGYFVEYLDWRMIFFINVPICLFGAVAAQMVFPRYRPTSWPRFDLWGFVTIAYGLFAVLLATAEGNDWGWDGYRIRILFVSALISFALFVVIELESDNPLINLRVFKSWTYTAAVLLISIVLVALTAMLYFAPQFLQVVQGKQAFEAGLILAPAALMLLLVNPLTQKLFATFGARIPIALGFAIMAYGMSLMATATPDTTRLTMIFWTGIVNLGAGLIFMPVFSGGLIEIPPEITSSATGMINVAQRTAASIAVALFGSLSASASAQLMLDRGSLLSGGAQALPEVTEAAAHGVAGMGGMYQTLSRAVLTQTYGNGYYLVSFLCLAGSVIALTMKSSKPVPGAVVHVEM
ncbi:DHA2 family efflux MFS transporter permease subunit [Pseudonocardia spinosispora]|uniref:DHA2 family efflux MFS transporter permease subunit n=1 Tax=Pseudonocardia spinosispora TaxID=103441 RepID=UPI0004192041|nr:DHA2 family efflux MFS transporter permease subunit [Pseudonocardia spinosispora]